jgi:hypothetical protein
MTRYRYTSLTRIADLESRSWQEEPVDTSNWEAGDYVVGEVTGVPSDLYHIEATDGEMLAAKPGDFVVGALGDREATLEGVGSFRAVEKGHMHALTSAGLFGLFTSYSQFLPAPMSLEYRGHILRQNEKVRMRDFAIAASGNTFEVPTILLVGTSMSAGKTVTGCLVCQVLSAAGHRVIGAKLTGAGRYRDILSFREAGAAEVYDFVDVGLPSTVVPEAEFRTAIVPLLEHIGSRQPDFLVAEAGASPLEPYNGEAAIDVLGNNTRLTILCASDPYAVVGVQHAFDLTPDLVTGPATNTSAAIALVDKLTGVPAINVVAPGAEIKMKRFLEARNVGNRHR